MMLGISVVVTNVSRRLMIPRTTTTKRVVKNILQSIIKPFLINPPFSRCYSLAITRQISPHFANALSSSSTNDEICLKRAQIQHEAYVERLRTLLPSCLELRPLNDHPDCVFVEDTIVAIGNTAVMTCPGHASRRGEVSSIRAVVQQQQLGMTVIDMMHPQQQDAAATCDGGDVLYTGRHLFVGQSRRTNRSGFQFLQNVFESSTCRVIPIQLVNNNNKAQEEPLHLKSIVTQLDEETLLVPKGSLGNDVLTQINNNHENFKYRAIHLPYPLACNVVSINGNILAQHGGCMESQTLLEQACTERGLSLHWMDASEFAKVDGSLTCCSILLDI